MDELRSLTEIAQRDVRNRWARFGADGMRELLLEDHHADVAGLTLIGAVPESVATKFETAKNLYLYAWFVYRFYPVAELHALTCLELGLRERFPEFVCSYESKSKKGKSPTLHPLLSHAIDKRVITNEGLSGWQDQVQRRANQRYEQEMMQKMIREGLQTMELDYEQATPDESDRQWDYLEALTRSLPAIRNAYAHGSSMIHGRSLGTLSLVQELLNQLFFQGSASEVET